MRREGGYMYQTHPRTKGSTGFPDKILETDHFRDPRYLGAGWKAMPSDLSSPRLGDRSFDLLDDLSNQGLRKRIFGEVDMFQFDHTDELYAHMNINYIKLDRLPAFERWGDAVEPLARGDFFTTTGEVLIPRVDFRNQARTKWSSRSTPSGRFRFATPRSCGATAKPPTARRFRSARRANSASERLNGARQPPAGNGHASPSGMWRATARS